MSNENGIVRYQAPATLTRFQPQTLEEIVTLANLFEKSGMFPLESGRQTAAQLAVKILAGQELGLTPFAAANGMQIIKGRCAPSANTMAAKVKASGRYDYRVTKMTDGEVSIEFFEHGKSVGISAFTAADANKAGTQNMGKFPRNMLFARALSNGVKWFCPDLFSGVAVYTPDEMGATVDYETGDVLSVPSESTASDAQPAAIEERTEFNDNRPSQITKPQLNTLHALGVALYGDQSAWDAKRPALVRWASKKATDSSADLSQADADVLIAELEKKVRVEYERIAQPHVDASNVEALVDADSLHGVELANALKSLRKEPVPVAKIDNLFDHEAEPA